MKEHVMNLMMFMCIMAQGVFFNKQEGKLSTQKGKKRKGTSSSELGEDTHEEQAVSDEDIFFQYVKPENIPIGFKFRPTDSEIITNYLAKKVRCDPSIPPADILDIRASEFFIKHPKELIHDDRVCFFFIQQDENKYRNRPIRELPHGIGYWKHMVEDKFLIYDKEENIIGYKTLSKFFRKSRCSPKKTHWCLEEFELATPNDFDDENKEYKLAKLMRGKEYEGE